MKSCKSEKRRLSAGFTLVELLVVIAIIGVLIALLLPAVQAAREAARRSQCSNNMKQIGLAMHTYHDTHGVLPYGATLSLDSGGTWVAFILPFMEQQNIFDLFDFDVHLVAPENRIAVTTIIDTLICPSDPDADEPLLAGRAQPNVNPEGSLGLWYAGCMGPTNNAVCNSFCPEDEPSYCCNGEPNYSVATVGIFARNADGRSFRQIPDGLSNTMMVGEVLPGLCAYHGAYHNNYPMADTVIPLNNFTESFRERQYWLACGFKSLHPGGANFVMADASVQFFVESIDYRVWNAIGSRDGGEAITLPF